MKSKIPAFMPARLTRSAQKALAASAQHAVTAPTLPPKRSGLVGYPLFNTGAFPADGGLRAASWQNTTENTMLIASCVLWLGVDKDCACDAHCDFTRSDGSYLGSLAVDHYLNGNRAVELQLNYAPDYFEVYPGEWLGITYFARAIAPARFNAAFRCNLVWKWK